MPLTILVRGIFSGVSSSLVDKRRMDDHAVPSVPEHSCPTLNIAGQLWCTWGIPVSVSPVCLSHEYMGTLVNQEVVSSGQRLSHHHDMDTCSVTMDQETLKQRQDVLRVFRTLVLYRFGDVLKEDEDRLVLVLDLVQFKSLSQYTIQE